MISEWYQKQISGTKIKQGWSPYSLTGLKVAPVPCTPPSSIIERAVMNSGRWFVACKTGVIFCVFSGERGQARGKRGARVPRACARSPEKRKKNNACSAGYWFEDRLHLLLGDTGPEQILINIQEDILK